MLAVYYYVNYSTIVIVTSVNYSTIFMRVIEKNLKQR